MLCINHSPDDVALSRSCSTVSSPLLSIITYSLYFISGSKLTPFTNPFHHNPLEPTGLFHRTLFAVES